MLLGNTTTAGSFRCMFQEFRLVPDVVCQSYLDQAAARLSAEVLGPAYDEAHGNLTAHLIAASPAGISLRLVRQDQTSTYSDKVDEIRDSFCHAVMVT